MSIHGHVFLSGWWVFSSDGTWTTNWMMSKKRWWMMNIVSIWRSASNFMIHNFSQRRGASQRWSTPSSHHHWVRHRCINPVSDMMNLLLSVQISANNVVSLYERVQFPLQVFVLLSQKQWVFLKSFVLRLEIKISVHECLVRIVNSF